nr:MAG TPA: hypothetical protein [Caudoviricetes sp.]
MKIMSYLCGVNSDFPVLVCNLHFKYNLKRKKDAKSASDRGSNNPPLL